MCISYSQEGNRVEVIEDEGGWITDKDVRLLLEKLNPEGYVRVTTPLKGSKKNLGKNTVFKICKINISQTSFQNIVVKIGTPENLEKEYQNYLKYIKNGFLDSEYAVQLHEPIIHNDKAILPIDFVNVENYQILKDYYKESPDETLELLLSDVLKPLHQAGKIKQRDVNSYFVSRLKYHKNSLFQECERLFPGVINSHSCLVSEVKKVLTNPVFY